LSRRRRRVRDKWRSKDWYTIYSPPYFGGAVIGTTPSDDPDKLMSRVIETTLYDLTDDFSQQHIKLFFQIFEFNENKLKTIFKGHEYSSDYLRSLVRRGSTRVDLIYDLTTQDDYRIRASFVAFSVVRIKTSHITGIRVLASQILEEKAKTLNFDQFVQEAVLGKIASDIYNEAKKVVPLRHVGIRKTKLISYPNPRREEKSIEIKA
jgi:small subunit ribosomal protein S3Ae